MERGLTAALASALWLPMERASALELGSTLLLLMEKESAPEQASALSSLTEKGSTLQPAPSALLLLQTELLVRFSAMRRPALERGRSMALERR